MIALTKKYPAWQFMEATTFERQSNINVALTWCMFAILVIVAFTIALIVQDSRLSQKRLAIEEQRLLSQQAQMAMETQMLQMATMRDNEFYASMEITTQNQILSREEHTAYRKILNTHSELGEKLILPKPVDYRPSGKIKTTPLPRTGISTIKPITQTLRPSMLPMFLPYQIFKAQVEQIDTTGFNKYGYPAIAIALIALVGAMVKYQHEERKEELEQRNKIAEASLQNAVETKAQTTLVATELQTIKTMLNDIRNS